VWDYLRDDYSQLEFTLYGNDSSLLSPSPYVVTTNFVESVTFGGSVLYQCTNGASGSESLLDERFYYGFADPSRVGRNAGIDPTSGLIIYEYTAGSVFIEVTVCEPTPTVRITQITRYSFYQSADPSSDLSTAGYTLDPTWGGTGDRWKRIDGDITHYVTQDNTTSTIWHIESTYLKTVTGEANIMSAFPSTITVNPPFNPFSIYTETVFS
jgi:hypothetical protein